MKIVTAAIIIKNNFLLIARRKGETELAGYWEFPGGKIEPRETAKLCIAREINEELSVDITDINYFTKSIYHSKK